MSNSGKGTETFDVDSIKYDEVTSNIEKVKQLDLKEGIEYLKTDDIIGYNSFMILDLMEKEWTARNKDVDKLDRLLVTLALHIKDEKSFISLQRSFNVADSDLISRSEFYKVYSNYLTRDKSEYRVQNDFVNFVLYNLKKLLRKTNNNYELSIGKKRKANSPISDYLYQVSQERYHKLGENTKIMIPADKEGKKILRANNLVCQRVCEPIYEDGQSYYDTMFTMSKYMTDKKDDLRDTYYTFTDTPLTPVRGAGLPYQNKDIDIETFEKCKKQLENVFDMQADGIRKPVFKGQKKSGNLFINDCRVKRVYKSKRNRLLNLFKTKRKDIYIKIQTDRDSYRYTKNGTPDKYDISNIELISLFAKEMALANIDATTSGLFRRKDKYRKIKDEFTYGFRKVVDRKKLFNAILTYSKRGSFSAWKKSIKYWPFVSECASLISARYILWSMDFGKEKTGVAQSIDMGLEFALANKLSFFKERNAKWVLPVINEIGKKQAYFYYMKAGVSLDRVAFGMKRAKLNPFDYKNLPLSETQLDDYNNLIYGNANLDKLYFNDFSNSSSFDTEIENIDNKIDEKENVLDKALKVAKSEIETDSKKDDELLEKVNSVSEDYNMKQDPMYYNTINKQQAVWEQDGLYESLKSMSEDVSSDKFIQENEVIVERKAKQDFFKEKVKDNYLDSLISSSNPNTKRKIGQKPQNEKLDTLSNKRFADSVNKFVSKKVLPTIHKEKLKIEKNIECLKLVSKKDEETFKKIKEECGKIININKLIVTVIETSDVLSRVNNLTSQKTMTYKKNVEGSKEKDLVFVREINTLINQIIASSYKFGDDYDGLTNVGKIKKYLNDNNIDIKKWANDLVVEYIENIKNSSDCKKRNDNERKY